ncbi:VP4 [Kummerowia striata gokushovirus]|nr:VP4 [Kummerowia striata gokushovirus]
MPCHYPIPAYQNLETRQVVFKETANTRPLTISCGRCVGCKLIRAGEWALRCIHESRMHEQNSFLTATYDEEHAPQDDSLHKSHLQKLFKRLRFAGYKFRYYACGEYGDLTQRPHYHICLFGHDFREDRVLWTDTEGHKLYRSPNLEKIWGNGQILIGELNYATAAYCAKYTMKKKFSDGGGYATLNAETGELSYLEQPFAIMSLRPAIGLTWLLKYHADVYHEKKDFIINNGIKHRPPKYYDHVYENRINWQRMEYLKGERAKNSTTMTETELRAHEKNARAKTKLKQAKI